MSYFMFVPAVAVAVCVWRLLTTSFSLVTFVYACVAASLGSGLGIAVAVVVASQGRVSVRAQTLAFYVGTCAGAALALVALEAVLRSRRG